MNHPTVPEITGVRGAVATALSDDLCKKDRTSVGRKPAGRRITDSEREAAICKAGELLELFMAERSLYEALWARDGDFTHKAAADKALTFAQWAERSMFHLIAGRSPEMVARLKEGCVA